MEPTATDDEAVLAAFPGILIDHDTKAYYAGLLQHKMLINRCEDCGTWRFPNRAMCPACWSDNVVPTEVSGRGTIYLLTFVHQSRQGPQPASGAPGPYAVAAVELAERARFTSTIVNCPNDEIHIGMPVELTWIEQDGMPFPAFQPAARQRGDA